MNYYRNSRCLCTRAVPKRDYRQQPYLFLFLLTLLLAAMPAYAEERELTIAIANSLCGPMGEISTEFAQHSGIVTKLICKSSGRLAKGLSGRAIRADFFISANRKWIEFTVDKGLAEREQIVDLWNNSLVVAALKHSPVLLKDLGDLLRGTIRRLIIGDPGTTPFGRYTKQALVNAGVWSDVKHKVRTKRHVTLAMEWLIRSSPDTVAIIYRTNLTPHARVVLEIPSHLHDPIRYFGVPLVSSARIQATGALAEFLHSPRADAIFSRWGFGIPWTEPGETAPSGVQ